jgi:hypothetical protein
VAIASAIEALRQSERYWHSRESGGLAANVGTCVDWRVSMCFISAAIRDVCSRNCLPDCS